MEPEGEEQGDEKGEDGGGKVLRDGIDDPKVSNGVTNTWRSETTEE